MIQFTINPYASDINLLKHLINTNKDIFKSLDSEDIKELIKSTNRAHLIPVKVMTQGFKTKPHLTTVYKNPNNPSEKHMGHYKLVVKWSKLHQPDEYEQQASVDKIHQFITTTTQCWQNNEYFQSSELQTHYKITKLPIINVSVTACKENSLTANITLNIPYDLLKHSNCESQLNYLFTQSQSGIEGKRNVSKMKKNKNGTVTVVLNWEHWNKQYVKQKKLKNAFIAKPIESIAYTPNFTDMHSFNTNEDAMEYMGMSPTDNGISAQWLQNNSKKETLACTSYTNGGGYYSGSLNGFLRRLNQIDSESSYYESSASSVYTKKDLDGYKVLTKHLDSAISKFILPKPIEVHRFVYKELGGTGWKGEGMLHKLTQCYNEGKPFQEDGYCSTTLVKTAMDEYSSAEQKQNQIHLHIKVPAGKGIGAWIAPVALPDYQDEMEFLLARGTQFRVITDMNSIDTNGPIDVELEVMGRNVYDLNDIAHELADKDMMILTNPPTHRVDKIDLATEPYSHVETNDWDDDDWDDYNVNRSNSHNTSEKVNDSHNA